MSLIFYFLSGSPFSWKVWMALEHAGLSYEPRRLRVDAGDLQTPAFRALNPKGKLPVLVDGDLAIAESDAIAEYLAELASEAGTLLWPAGRKSRALARRFASAANAYVYPAVRLIMEQTLFRKEGEPDPAIIAEAKEQLGSDLMLLSTCLQGNYAGGESPGIADFTLYPFIALLGRSDAKMPGQDASAPIPPALLTWSKRIEALPWFARTIPSHWQEG